MNKDRFEVRCFCSRKPLLAMAGLGRDGKPFVHVKTWKQKQLYAEIIVTSGTSHIRCRECKRWHRIRIVEKNLNISLQHLPETLAI